MVDVKLRLLIFSSSLIICLCSTVKCATFENVNVSLKAPPDGLDEAKQVFISSGNNLSEHIGDEPFGIIEIIGYKIPILTKNSMSNLPNTFHISIMRCGLRDIEPGTFNNLPKLTSIALSNNEIRMLRNGVFKNLNINSLELTGNKLSTWNGESIRGSSLQFIDLSYNQIEEIPENALAYVKPKNDEENLDIYSFDVSHNKVKKIHPKAFNGLHSLNFLFLSYNELTEIPVEMFAHTKRFYYVGFDFNKLSCFPLFEVMQVTSVSKVALQNNPLMCECVKNWLENEEEARKVFTDGDINTFKKKCNASL